MPSRGVLHDEDGALTAADLAIKTGYKERIFETAFSVLSRPEIRWLEEIDVPISGNPPDASGNPPGERRKEGREGKKEEKETHTPKRLHGIPASVEEVIEFGKTCQPKPVSEARCSAFWAHYEGQAKTNPNGDMFWVTSGQGGEIVVTNWKVKLPQFALNEGSARTDRTNPRNVGIPAAKDGGHHADTFKRKAIR